jgi:hypothetical protein
LVRHIILHSVLLGQSYHRQAMTHDKAASGVLLTRVDILAGYMCSR